MSQTLNRERLTTFGLVGAIIAGIAGAIFYLVYWGIESQDCKNWFMFQESLAFAHQRGPLMMDEYYSCLEHKALPVFEKWEWPRIDFVEDDPYSEVEKQ